MKFSHSAGSISVHLDVPMNRYKPSVMRICNVLRTPSIIRSFLYFEEDVKFAVWEELKDRDLDNQTTGEGSPGEILEEQEQDREARQT